MMKDLEKRLLNYEVIGEFLANLKEKFREGGEKTNKIAEWKRLKQEGK